MKYKPSKLVLFLDIILMGLFIAADQVCKFLAVEKLMGKPSFILVDGVLELSYLENRGAAFGILQNQQWVFLVAGSCFVIFAVALLIYFPTEAKYRALRIAILMIASGAVGNLIDRATLNYVVDFIYFSYINFPIFNVADIFVTVGTALLVILILFFYKEEDLDLKKARTKKLHSSMLSEDKKEQ